MFEAIKNWLLDPTVGTFLTAFIALVVILSLSRAAKISVTRYVESVDSRYRLRKFITILSYAIVILVLSIIFSDRLGGLTVALGVAGAGIAFALQEVIASFAGWFAVTFAGFYEPGDRVQLGGIKGDVIDIGFLRTTLMEVGEWVNGDLYSGRVVRIANSFVFKEPVFNYSGDFPFLWDEIVVPVKHGSDHRRMREILETVARETVGEYAVGAESAWQRFSKRYLLEQTTTAPTVTMIATDNWLEFTLRYVVDFKLRRSTKDLLFTRIVDEIAATDGKVSLASATFAVVDAPPLRVSINGEPE
jgi:small-conductance mechanosensitive channel